MTDIEWDCGRNAIAEAGDNSGTSSFSLGADPPTTIEPTNTVPFRCTITVPDNGQMMLQPVMRYKILIFSREYKGSTFTWYPYASPPQWEKSGG